MGFDFWAQNGVVGRAESWWLLKLKALCCRLQVKVVVGCRHSWTQSGQCADCTITLLFAILEQQWH